MVWVCVIWYHRQDNYWVHIARTKEAAINIRLTGRTLKFKDNLKFKDDISSEYDISPGEWGVYETPSYYNNIEVKK